MKVKITYTTEFDKVPEECWRLLDNNVHNGYAVCEQLKLVYDSLNAEPFDSFYALEQIHKLRLVLADYDQCLADIDTILTGFGNVRLQKHQQQNTMYSEQGQQQVNNPNDLLEQLNALKEKLQSSQEETEQEQHDELD